MEETMRLECLKLAATHDRTGDSIIVLLAAAKWAEFVIRGFEQEPPRKD